MAWDTLNYHLYLGFSTPNDRFGQDYFAAVPLSYLNPLRTYLRRNGRCQGQLWTGKIQQSDPPK
jgi:hypothetical protein